MVKQVGGSRVLGFLGALFLSGALGTGLGGCGGRSIEDGNGRDDDSQDDPKEPSEPAQTCWDACEQASRCSNTIGDCEFFCGQAETASREAGCSRSYSALVGCLTKADNICAARNVCVAETNAFAVCVLDYCGRNINAAICGT